MEFFAVIAWLVLCGAAAAYASNKGRSGPGIFFLSLFLSPLVGFLVAASMKPHQQKLAEAKGMKRCPDCAQFVEAGAKTCPFCKKDLSPQIALSAGEFDPGVVSKKCPDCAETIKLEALVCRFCGRRFDPTEVQVAIERAKAEFDAEFNVKLANAKRAAIDSSLVCPKCGGIHATAAGGFSLWERMECPDCGHKW